MDVKELLIVQLEANFGILQKNLDGITESESLYFPETGGNSLNWVLGHIIYSRNLLLEMLGNKGMWDNSYNTYNRGANPKEKIADFKTLSDLKSLLSKSQNKLIATLKNLEITSDELKPVTFLVFHEIYHSGQIGYIRRILGKKGAIK